MAKSLDLDSLLIDDGEEDDPVETVPATLLGKTFHIRKDVNACQLARLSDPDQVAAAMTRILINAVIDEERADFVATLGGIKKLTIPKLTALLDAVVGAAADGVPTKSVPASRRTTPKKVAARRSGARSAAEA
jgi:hypothetical protein